MGIEPRGNTFLSRVQPILDTLATVGIIAASAVFLWRMASPGGGSVNAPRQPNSRAAPLTIPAEPVSLAGAAVEGNTRAPIAIIEYSDFQCPYCATFARETLPKLREKYVSPGKVLVAFRHFPLSGLHQLAEKAAETAECAGRQGKFWEMHDQLFSKQKELGDLQMLKMAQQIHLDPTQFDRCLRGEATARVSQDSDSAKALGISGTPSFLIGNIQSDGLVRVARVLVGIQSLDQFDDVLAQIAPPTQARR